MDYDRVWVCDSETFRYDNFWVFKHYLTRDTVRIHNDNIALARFLEEYDPILCGYNIRDYDQHILRAGLENFSPEEIKDLNDYIIAEKLSPWDWFRNQEVGWTTIPPLIDLIHDIVGRPSLKQLQGFMGMSIEESTIPWDLDRPMTAEEVEETFMYCEHDVDSTCEILTLRKDYVSNRTMLCELNEVDPLTELKHPNARVASDILGAEWEEYDNEPYVLPDAIDVDNIPDVVMEFVNNLDRDLGRMKKSEVEEAGLKGFPTFDFHGMGVGFGVGGIHGAIGYTQVKQSKGKDVVIKVSTPYQERATDTRAIFLQDIGSYYPSLIIGYDYMSRSVLPEAKQMFKDFYDLRMEAKADGDAATANACKLILNTVYGAMKSKHNALADSMQATNVCVSGQLFIIDLLHRIVTAADSVKLIQANTDGWMYSIDREQIPLVDAVVEQWKVETGFSVSTDEVEAVWQRDVNSYIALFKDGEIHAKGAPVKDHLGRGAGWESRGFTMSRAIVDKAIVNHLVYGTPIEDTINNEDDLSWFQIITKGGGSYAAVWGDVVDVHEVIPEGSRRRVPKVIDRVKGFKTNNVNRIYATKDTSRGRLMKERAKDGGLERFSDTPEHAFVDNTNTEMTLDMLDRDWYIVLAQKKLKEFVGKEGVNMAETTETTETAKTTTTAKRATTPRKPAAKKEVELTFGEKYLALQKLVRETTLKLVPESFIEHIGYEYVQTPIYRDILMESCLAVGLVYTARFEEFEFLGAIQHTKGGANEYGSTVKVVAQITNPSNPEESITLSAYGFGLGSGGNTVSSSHTNAERNLIINGFLVKTSFDDDVSTANKGDSGDKKPSGYVSDEAKAAATQKVKRDTQASVTYVQKPAAVDLQERVAEMLADKTVDLSDKNRAAFEKLLTDHYEEDGTPKVDGDHLTLTSKLYTAYTTQLDEMGV